MLLDCCDVCGKKGEVFVRASTFGALSLAYCESCLQDGLEPYSIMVAYISGAGYFPTDINERYQAHVRHILCKLGVPETTFIEDVKKCVDDVPVADSMEYLGGEEMANEVMFRQWGRGHGKDEWECASCGFMTEVMVGKKPTDTGITHCPQCNGEIAQEQSLWRVS